MVGLQTLDLAIGVRVPASQPKHSSPNPLTKFLTRVSLVDRLCLLTKTN